MSIAVFFCCFGFNAAQAAQKFHDARHTAATKFNAAQAAQKNQKQAKIRNLQFNAAQAAQKSALSVAR